MKIFSSFFKSCFMLILKAERWSEHWWRFSCRRFMIWSTWSEHMLDVGGSGGTVAVCCRRSAVRPHVCTSISFSFIDWQSTKSKWSECVTLRNSTHTHTDTHRHTHRHTLTHTHRNTQRHSQTHAHTQRYTHSQTHTHRHTHRNTRRHSQTHSRTLTHTEIHPRTHSHRHIHTETFAHTPSQTNTHTHTLMVASGQFAGVAFSCEAALWTCVCKVCDWSVGWWCSGSHVSHCLLSFALVYFDSASWLVRALRPVWWFQEGVISLSVAAVRPTRGSARVCLWDACSRASSLIVY